MTQADGESGTRRSRALFDPVAGHARRWRTSRPRGCAPRASCSSGCCAPSPTATTPRATSPAGEYTALVDAWTDLLRRTVAGLARRGRPRRRDGRRRRRRRRPAGAPRAARVRGRRRRRGGGLAPQRHRPRASARSRCAAAQLSDADGSVLDGAEVRFEPREVELLPPRSSRAVAVSLAATAAPAPGHLPRHDPGPRRPGPLAAARGGDRAVLTADGAQLVEAYADDVEPPRPPLDARRHPRRRAAPLALPRGARVPEPAREGDPARAVRGDEPRVRRERRRRPAGRRGDRAAAQRLPRPRRHRRRQRAAARPARRSPRSTASGSPSTPATRWPCSPTRSCGATRAACGRRRSPTASCPSSTPWRCARSRARPPSSAGATTASTRSSPRTTST